MRSIFFKVSTQEPLRGIALFPKLNSLKLIFELYNIPVLVSLPANSLPLSKLTLWPIIPFNLHLFKLYLIYCLFQYLKVGTCLSHSMHIIIWIWDLWYITLESRRRLGLIVWHWVNVFLEPSFQNLDRCWNLDNVIGIISYEKSRIF